jgi:hypothetical protein
MKKRLSHFLSAVLILLSAVVLNFPRGLHPQGGPPENASFSKLSLGLDSTKKEFIQLEPIPIILTLDNKTSEDIKGHSAIDISQNYIKLLVAQPGAEVREVRELSLNRKLVVASAKLIKPGDHYQSSQLLTINLDEVFPEPGLYQLQAVLMDSDGKREVKSNKLTLRIVRPEGLDYQAFEYIKEIGTPSSFFYGVNIPGTKNTQKVLEEFESAFGASRYGDYSSFLLGEFYFSKRDYAKAYEKFDKVAKKANFIFTEKAKQYLEKIEKENTISKKSPHFGSDIGAILFQRIQPDKHFV